MNINLKKTAKIITLLVCSVLIATVSAEIYSYMYIEGSGEITTGGLSWAKGNDAPAGSSVDGVYIRNLNLSIPKDIPRNFTDCLHLINSDASNHTFSLEATVTSGNTAKFTTFDMVVYNSTGGGITEISIKGGGSASGLAIKGSETLYVRFEVVPLTGETSGSIAFTVKLTYE